jgi:hypothetical protein
MHTHQGNKKFFISVVIGSGRYYFHSVHNSGLSGYFSKPSYLKDLYSQTVLRILIALSNSSRLSQIAVDVGYSVETQFSSLNATNSPTDMPYFSISI